MTTSRCASWPSTPPPQKQPLQLPPEQPFTIAHLLCCGAMHLYVDGLSTASERKEFSPQQD
jgi:hypothetical protein